MIEKQSLPDERIAKCLREDYGFDIDSLAFLPIGANASVYKARMRDGTSYFVKLKHGHQHDISVAVATWLFDSGIEQIIPPIKTIHGQLTQPVSDFTLIVYPFIEGQDGFSHHLGDSQWVTLGTVLKRVHDIRVPASIAGQVRRETYAPKWREAVRMLYEHLEAGANGDETAVKLAEFMKENAATIHRLVDRSEQLAHEISNRPPEFVLCHSDIHGGNVLIDKNDTLYIVDWDEPIMAPKERDLMFIGGGIHGVWNEPEEEALFYKGYGNAEVDSQILAYYRHERIVEDIALYGQNLLLSNAGGGDRPAMLRLVQEMFDPKGAVEMAFKVDHDIH